MNELTKIKNRILRRLDRERFMVSEAPNEDEKAKGIFLRTYDAIRDTTAKNIINEEFDRAFLEAPNIEQIIKDTIKKYLDKDCDDVIELLLSLSKDLCERIKHEDEKATAAQLKTECSRKENKPRLSKSAFVVIDHVLKEHEEHEDRFTTFCDGRHQQITVKQINAELDKLYNYFYGKGEGSGEGTK